MKSRGLIIIVIFFVFQSTLPAFSEISRIHFGSANTPYDGLTITWTSNGSQDQIRWGYTSSYEMGSHTVSYRSHNSWRLFDYSFPVVLSDTVIYYSIYDSESGAWTEQKTFRTASKNKSSFTFKAMGDSQTDPNAWHAISSITPPSDFTIFTGDIVATGGSIIQWDNWFIKGEKFLEDNLFYSALGNHELDSDPDANYYQNILTLPTNDQGSELYYTFKHKDALFICLNSSRANSSDQYNWLLNTLENNQDAKWKIVWFHIPFFTSPIHANEMNNYLSTWWKAFDDYGVDLIFNGHTHNYQRSVPINRNVSTDSPVSSYGDCADQGRCQIVTGGAGASNHGTGNGWFIDNTFSDKHYIICEVFDDRIDIKTYDSNNDLRDDFSLNKDLNIDISASATSVCEGQAVTLTASGAESYTWDNNVQNGVAFVPTETKTYTVTASSGGGCTKTSSVTVELTSQSYITEYITTCSSDSVYWRGSYYHEAGIYLKPVENQNGCDSIFELRLSMNTASISSETKSICQGDSALWRGEYYDRAGRYLDLQASATGCDNVFELNLEYHPSYAISDKELVCEGDSLLWYGQYYKQEGVYSKYNTTRLGCDSTSRLELTIVPLPPKPVISGPAEVYAYDYIQYSVPDLYNHQHHWSAVNGEVLSEYLNEVEIKWAEPGIGYVFLSRTNQHNCSSGSVMQVFINEGNINSAEPTMGRELVVYPNPANDHINIQYPAEFIAEIYSLSGEKLIITDRLSTDISSLVPGIYFIQITDKNNLFQESHKLVVE